MKRTGILLLCTALLLPSYFILAESEVTKIEATIEKGTASLDDLILELNGKITVLEENHSYQYDFNDLTIIIDLTKGYSLVNNQPEPYLLTPSELDETVLNIVWHLPTQIENEIYVPIQFIERIFNATYEESTQSFKLKEAVEIEEAVEDVVVKPQTKPVIKPVQPTPTPNEDDATEHNPPQTPSAPVTPKPEATPPLPPSNPEQPEVETPPAVIPPVVPPVIGEPDGDGEEEVVPPVEESPETPELTPPDEETPEEPEQPENPNPPIENPETSTPDSVLPEE